MQAAGCGGKKILKNGRRGAFEINHLNQSPKNTGYARNLPQ